MSYYLNMIQCPVNSIEEFQLMLVNFHLLEYPLDEIFFFFFFPSIRGALIPDSNCYVRVGK